MEDIDGGLHPAVDGQSLDERWKMKYFLGTIDLNHFILFSLTLTMGGDQKVSRKQNLLASFSYTLFIWSGWNVMWWGSNSRWTPWDYFWLWVRFSETREITAVLLTASKQFNIVMHLDVYEWIWFKIGMIIDTSILCVLILVLLSWPSFEVTGVWESKNFCANYLTKFSFGLNGMWYTIETW